MNCIAWLVYGIQKKDYFIFFGNMSGVILGTFYSLSALVVLAKSSDPNDETRLRKLETFLYLGTIYLAIVALIVGLIFTSDQNNMGEIIFASSGNFFAIFYYATPLSTIVDIFKTKDSSSLHRPMLIANTINASSWFIYGLFGIQDPFVWAPNGIGASLSVFQLCLTIIYPSSGVTRKTADSTQNSILLYQPDSSKTMRLTVDI